MRARAIVFMALALAATDTLAAQHTRQSLLQPTRADYNLVGPVRQVTSVQRYEGGNDMNMQEVYEFDSVGRLTAYRKRGFGGERVTQYPPERLDPSVEYSFDFDDDVLESRHHDLQGRLTASVHYIYSQTGRLVQTIEYRYANGQGVVSQRTVSDYDGHERLASIRQYSSDELLLMSEKRRYDRRGNLKRRTQRFYSYGAEDKSSEQRGYTYDAHGNWTECRYTHNGKPLYTIVRTVEYFE